MTSKNYFFGLTFIKYDFIYILASNAEKKCLVARANMCRIMSEKTSNSNVRAAWRGALAPRLPHGRYYWRVLRTLSYLNQITVSP